MCDYYYEDGAPKKCVNCKSEDFKEKVMDSIDGLVCEYEIRCASCNQSLAYWAYGGFDPAYLEYHEFMARKESQALVAKHGVSDGRQSKAL